MLKCRILINIIPARQQKEREREHATVTAAAAAIAAQMLNKVAQKVS